MNKLVCLPADQGPVYKAAVWLRKHLDIPAYETMESQFEEYFNCKVVREPPTRFSLWSNICCVRQ